MRFISIFVFIIASFTASADSAGAYEKVKGVWQFSKAYWGAIPWNHNVLRISDNEFVIESEGKVRERFKYTVESDSPNAVVLKGSGAEVRNIYNSDQIYVRLTLNPHYGCKGSKLKYNKNCPSTGNKMLFTYCLTKEFDVAQSQENGRCLDAQSYFSFTNDQLKELNSSL